MISTSDTYKLIIDSAVKTRLFDIRVKVYYDGLTNAPVLYTKADIRSASIVYDSKVTDALPFGYLALATFSMTVNNTNRQFTLTNEDSPLYGRIKAGTPMEVEIGLCVATDTFEYINMGKFYIGDWDTDTDSAAAIITCYDRLYLLYEKNTPEFRLQHNITLFALFDNFFTLLGIPENERKIDAGLLDIVIPFGWLPGRKVKDTFLELCKAGICQVYVDRNNSIVVVPVYKERKRDKVLRNNEQVFSIRQPQSLYKAYSGVEVEYFSTSVEKEVSNIARITDIQLVAGNNNLSDISFGSSPVDKISHCILADDKKHIVFPTAYGATGIDLTVVAVESDTADIEVFGYALEQKGRTFKVNGGVKYSEALEDKKLNVSSKLIQDKTYAQRYGEALVTIATDPTAYLELSIRGDPAMEIFDKTVVPTDSKAEVLIPAVITRMAINFGSNGYSTRINCTKAEAIELYYYIYLIPGFYTKAKKNRIIPEPKLIQDVYIGPGFYTQYKL